MKFPVTNKSIKQVVFDLSDFAGWPGLDADALVNINGTWEAKPRDLKGKPKLTFCLDKAEENVEEVRLILSNHDRLPTQFISTVVGMVATTAGCKGGWTGTSYTSDHASIQPTTKCVSNDIVWVFDPIGSDLYDEHYVAQGTVKYSRTYTDGTAIVHEYNPSTYAIDPSMQISEAGMHIRPDPSGIGFIVTGSATTAFPTTETTTLYGDPATAVSKQVSVSCQFFYAGPNGSKLPAGSTTISDTSNVVGDVHGYSFTKQ